MIEIALPIGDDYSRHAIAYQVPERARHADEPVDRENENQPDHRDARILRSIVDKTAARVTVNTTNFLAFLAGLTTL
jgi:hypothetical protein